MAFATDAIVGDGAWGDGRPEIAVLGEPLDAMVQNLGQTDGGYQALGSNINKLASQGFTTGSNGFGYRLQGIGVNIEGSSGNVPDGPTSVSVSVHADSGGEAGREAVRPGQSHRIPRRATASLRRRRKLDCRRTPPT